MPNRNPVSKLTLEERIRERKGLRICLRTLGWIVTAALFVVSYIVADNPHADCVLFFAAGVMCFPIDAWHDLMNERFRKNFIKYLVIILLIAGGIVVNLIKPPVSDFIDPTFSDTDETVTQTETK